MLKFGDGPEHFLVERRAPFRLGRWIGDEEVDGLVIVHVDMALTKPWLAQTDYDPWHPLLDVRHPTTRPEATVLDMWDEWRPSPDGARPPNAEGHRPADSNWYDGRSSGVGLRCIDFDRDQPGEDLWRLTAYGPGAWDPADKQPECDSVAPRDPTGSGADDGSGGSSGDQGCSTGGGPGPGWAALRR